MISSPAPDLVPGKSGPGKLGPSPIWRRIRPHTLWCCANWAPGAANLAHLEKVLDYGVKLQCSFIFCIQIWQILTFLCVLGNISQLNLYMVSNSIVSVWYRTYSANNLWDICLLEVSVFRKKENIAQSRHIPIDTYPPIVGTTYPITTN